MFALFAPLEQWITSSPLLSSVPDNPNVFIFRVKYRIPAAPHPRDPVAVGMLGVAPAVADNVLSARHIVEYPIHHSEQSRP